jgi:hypothetical protein
MHRASAAIVFAGCSVALSAGGCAHASRPIVLERPAAAVARLSELPPMPEVDVVVLLRSGATAMGAIETNDGDILVMRVTGDASITTRNFAEEEILCLARRVGKSTRTRGWLGALIGATASLPFGISMVGDMMVPAAIAGALIAGNTGQPRARVLLDRSHVVGSGLACPHSLRATPD